MASLAGKRPSNTYKDLLTVHGSTPNQGLESTAKRVFDGEGIGSPLYLGTDTLDIIGATTITGNTSVTGNLSVSGTLTAGTLSITTIGNDLTVSGDVSAVDLSLSGNATVAGDLTVTGDLTLDDITADDVKFDTIQLRNTTDDTYFTVFRLLDDNSATFGNKLDVMTDIVMKGTITLNSGTNTMVLDPDSTDQLVKGDGTKGKVSLTDTEVILKKDTKELLKAKEDGTIRFQSVNTLPSNPSNGDIVNKDGEVFVAKPS
jgi:hypothetical protein